MISDNANAHTSVQPLYRQILLALARSLPGKTEKRQPEEPRLGIGAAREQRLLEGPALCKEETDVLVLVPG